MRTERPSYADQLARTRALVQVQLPLPADLADWVLSQLQSQVHAEYVRLRRDQHLRVAGEIAGGSLSYRVRTILEEAGRLGRCWHLYRYSMPEPGTVRGAVHQARLVAQIPAKRQLMSILRRSVQSAAS